MFRCNSFQELLEFIFFFFSFFFFWGGGVRGGDLLREKARIHNYDQYIAIDSTSHLFQCGSRHPALSKQACTDSRVIMSYLFLFINLF